MNELLKGAGIDFFYFKRFTLIESESMLFARVTPGYNITWLPNNTIPLAQPQFLDLNSFKEYHNIEEPTPAKGIEMYMNEKPSAAFDL